MSSRLGFGTLLVAGDVLLWLTVFACLCFLTDIETVDAVITPNLVVAIVNLMLAAFYARGVG